MLAMISLGVWNAVRNDGKPKDGTYSARGALIGAGLIIALLHWGGFFK